MEDQIFTHHDVHLLVLAFAQLIEEQQQQPEMARLNQESVQRLLDRLTEMWNTQFDFIVSPLGGDNEGFTDPDQEIVDYVKAHPTQLNIRSQIVQRVLRLRMLEEAKAAPITPEAEPEREYIFLPAKDPRSGTAINRR